MKTNKYSVKWITVLVIHANDTARIYLIRFQ